MSKEMVFLNTKIQGDPARRIKEYATTRRISANGAAVELILRGLDSLDAAEAVDENSPILSMLSGMERRLAATVLAMRADLDALQAETDTSVVMLDALVKAILVHLPPPPENEKEGVTASAMARYDKWIRAIPQGYESDRPQVLARIAELLRARVGDADIGENAL